MCHYVTTVVKKTVSPEAGLDKKIATDAQMIFLVFLRSLFIFLAKTLKTPREKYLAPFWLCAKPWLSCFSRSRTSQKNYYRPACSPQLSLNGIA
jgi:hypothetical protein